MTTPPRLLADRIRKGEMKIVRLDGTDYPETDPAKIKALIDAECVEGVGSRSGRIFYLRMLVDEETARNRISTISRPSPRVRNAKGAWNYAPAEVFKQRLGDTLTCYTHRSNARLIHERFNLLPFNCDTENAGFIAGVMTVPLDPDGRPRRCETPSSHHKLFPPIKSTTGATL